MGRLGPSFGRLWTAHAISNLGDGVTVAAFPLLAATLTRDPILVAGAFAAHRLPWLVFPLVSGALADRLDRRAVIVAADLVRAGLLTFLVAAVLTDLLTLPLLYGVAFLLATAETLADSAAEAFLPALVGRGDLQRANSRLFVTELVGNQFLGPVLGGVLFALGASAPFAVDAATFAGAAVLVTLIRGRFHPQRGAERTGLGRDILDGLRWLLRHRVLRTLAISAGLTNLGGMMVLGIFVLYAQDVLGVGEVGYGILLATIGVGGLIGGTAAPAISARVGDARSLLLASGMIGVCALALAVTSVVGVVSAMLLLVGAGIAIWNVNSVSLRQELSPDAMRGRVASVARLLAWGTQPVGAALGGVVAASFGLRAPFVATAGIVLVEFALVATIVTPRAVAGARAAEAG